MGVIIYFDISKYRSKEIAQVLLVTTNTAVPLDETSAWCEKH